MVKTASWAFPDAEALRPGERRGLDTPVVLASNDVGLVSAPDRGSLPELTC